MILALVSCFCATGLATLPAMPAGFLHRGRRVYAVRYFLVAMAPLLREVIVWLRPDGYPECGGIRRQDGWPVVRTKSGDTLLVGGKKERVVAVEVYRADGLPVEY